VSPIQGSGINFSGPFPGPALRSSPGLGISDPWSSGVWAVSVVVHKSAFLSFLCLLVAIPAFRQQGVVWICEIRVKFEDDRSGFGG